MRPRLLSVCVFAAPLLLSASPPTGAGETGSIQLRLRVDGPEPAKFYVAAVREHARNSAPAVEKLISASTAALSLPAGRYRFIAGAAEYATEQSDTLVVSPGQEIAVVLTLQRLASVAGRVADDVGHPIHNARVGLPPSFRIDYIERLSALGESLLRQNELVTTDDTGSFLLPVRPTGSSFVFIEADGRTPTMLAGITAGQGSIGDVPLAQGAALEVRWQQHSSDYNRLRLIPVDVALPETLSLSSAVTLWTRPVANGFQAWSALPPGSYDLCLGTANEIFGPMRPVCVAFVTLRAGERKRARIELPRRRDFEPKSARLSILLIGVPVAESETIQITRWRNDVGERIDRRRIKKTNPHVLTITDGCIAGARYVLTSRSSLAVADAAGCGKAIRATLLPKATITIAVQTPPNAPLPSGAELQLFPCDRSASDPISMSIPFAVNTDGTAAVGVPGKCFLATVAAAGFSRVRLPRLELIPQQSRSLELRLDFGGSVTARVVDRLKHPLSSCTVRLFRADGGHTDGSEPDLDGGVAVTDSGGWAKFTSVSPGQYVVAATTGKRTKASRSFHVRAREEFLLPGLIVDEALSSQ